MTIGGVRLKNIFRRKLFGRHLTISMKFSVGLWIVLMIMLISTVTSTVLLYHTMQKAEDAQMAGERAAQITEIGSLFRSKDSRVVDYLLEPGDQAVKLYSQDQLKLTQAEKKLKPYMKTGEQKKWFSQIMSEDARTFNLFQSEFVPAVLMNDKEKLTQIHKEQNQIQARTLKLVNRLRTSVINEEQQAMKNVQKQVRGSMLFLAISVILSILISAGITWRISRQIKASFMRVIDSTEKIACGDLRNHGQIIHNKDELGLISDSIEKMKRNLLEMIQTMAQAAEMTKNSGQALIRSTRSVSHESKEMTNTTNQLAEGFENQARNAGHIAKFTEEFMNRLELEIKMLSTVLQKALNASELTEKGKVLIARSQENMRQIESSVLDSRNKMGHFKLQLNDLSKLVEMVDHIASQTNLLALNATIESARAGEAGKGFSIIAESIRKLSIQTSESAKEMTIMLKGVHLGSETVDKALLLNREQVQSGVKQITHTGDALISINHEAQEIRENMNELSLRLHEVSAIGVQMKESITAVAAVSQESSASVSHVNQSMSHVEKTMDGFVNEARALAETSERFEQLIQRFKL
jgi:methyl-accepting chemotaxis protein